MNFKKRILLLSPFLSLLILPSCSGGNTKENDAPKYAVNCICEYGDIVIDATRYTAGSTVNFEIFSKDYSQYLKGWDIYSTATNEILFSNVTSFVMPNENITIEGHFEKYNTKIKTIAHRGLNATYVETSDNSTSTLVPNSYKSFVAAGRQHFYGMETDVHKTKDGVWVCNHDKTYKSNDGMITISDKTFDEIKQIPIVDDGSGKSSTLCSVEDYLNIGKKYGKVCLLEIKEPLNDFGEDNLHDLIDFVKSVTELSAVKLISFYSDVLLNAKSYESGIKCQYLLSTDKSATMRDEINLAIRNKFDVSFHFSVCDVAYVTYAHQSGISVNVWTVNSKSMADLQISKGVDYLTTDSIYYENK